MSKHICIKATRKGKGGLLGLCTNQVEHMKYAKKKGKTSYVQEKCFCVVENI